MNTVAPIRISACAAALTIGYLKKFRLTPIMAQVVRQGFLTHNRHYLYEFVPYLIIGYKCLWDN
jgi:hypothetical protein